MLLSEAIRLGAAMGPKISYCDLFGPDDSSCALGSAAIAIGLTRHPLNAYGELRAAWPQLDRLQADKQGNLMAAIYRRNDLYNWTREEIADWLVSSGNDCESVQQQEAVETEAAELVTVRI
jgi:hypothetical protein